MDTSTTNTTFREFVQKMLKRANINQEYRDIFTNPENLTIFLTAFTDPSFDPLDNYQVLEFTGDGIIKGALSQYLPRRFPDLAIKVMRSKKGTSEGPLSKLRRYLEQRKTLSDFGLKLGFWDHVRADEKTRERLRKETLENVYEAFIGALVEVVDKNVKRGLGYYYAYNFIEANLNEIDIEVSAETLDDPITRLNELYKASDIIGGKKPLKWGDALYTPRKLFLPKVETLPPISTAKTGDLVFSVGDKSAFIATPKGWVHVSKAPLIEFHVPDPTTIPEDQSQLMWYQGVYGFFDAKEPVVINNESKVEILKNPDRYGASIIGQGLHFLSKEAKKIAADQALRYLERLGYKRDNVAAAERKRAAVE